MGVPPAAAPPGLRSTVPAALQLFFIFVSMGVLLPFLPLMVAARVRGSGELGLAMVVMPLLATLAPPLWGMLADGPLGRLRILRGTTAALVLAVWFVLPSHGLWQVALALTLFSLLRAPLLPLTDAMVRALLDHAPQRYGRLRMWGSIGFALAAWAGGELGGARHPERLLLVAAAAYACASITTFFLPSAPSSAPLRGIGAEVWRFIRQRPYPALLAATAIYYAAHATNDLFISVHLEQRGLSPAAIGAAWSLGVAVEVVVMFMGPTILGRTSSVPLLVLCCVAAALRWLLLATLEDPAALLTTQALHGLTFGLWYLVTIDVMQARAPAELRGSVQGLMMAALGCGNLVGYVGGGLLWDAVSSAGTYALAAAISALAALVYVWPARERAVALRAAER